MLASLALPYDHERVAGQIGVAGVALATGAALFLPARAPPEPGGAHRAVAGNGPGDRSGLVRGRWLELLRPLLPVGGGGGVLPPHAGAAPPSRWASWPCVRRRAGRRSGRSPASALADGGGGGRRGRRARGLPARQDRRARGLARRRRPHRPAHRPAEQAGVRGAVRKRARAGAPLERTSIRAARRSGRLQGRERPLRPRGRRRGAPPGGGGHAQVEAPGGHARPGSAARSSRCSCPRPTSAARSWWPSACAARPTAASPRTRWA